MSLRKVALFAVACGVTCAPFVGADDPPGRGTKRAYLQGRRPAEAATPDAGGDSCNDPVAIDVLPFSDSGDTTGAPSTINSIPLQCNNRFSAVTGPDHIYYFVVADGNSLNFTVTTRDPTYDPSIYITGTCNQSLTCVIGADNCFGNDLLVDCPSSSEAITNSFAPGLYFFYVDSYYAADNVDGRGAGAYSLSVTGDFPVELIQFTVD